MKFILLLVLIGFSINSYGDTCLNLEGSYQVNLPQDSIENVNFEVVKQNECISLRFYSGLWDNLIEGIKTNPNTVLKYFLDNKERCDAFGFCTTANATNSSIIINHSERLASNDNGSICKSNKVIYTINSNGALVTNRNYYGCKDGSAGYKTLIFPRYDQ